jgi:hypothetical protein
LLLLGPRKGRQPYTQQEGELLAQVAADVAQAIRRARTPVIARDDRRNGNGSDGAGQLIAAPAGTVRVGGQVAGLSADTGQGS